MKISLNANPKSFLFKAGIQMKNWILIFLLAAPAVSQTPVTRDMRRGTALSTDSLELSFRPSLGIASHFPSPIGVAEEEPIGANTVNPAVLAVPNPKWKHGSGGLVYTALMPHLNLPDHYSHVSYGGGRIGGFGVQARMSVYAFGSIRLDTTDANGWREFAGEEYALSVASAAYANRYAEHYLGLTGKVVSAPESFAEQGLNRYGYLIDIGYYGKIGKRFRVGLSALNLGIPIAGIRTAVYRDNYTSSTYTTFAARKDDSYLLTPASFHFGLGFDHSLNSARLHLLRTTVTGALSAEFERKGFSGARMLEAAALEFRILNVLSPALGVAFDGEQWQYRRFLGLFLFNHFSLGFSMLNAGDSIHRGQKTFSLEFRNPLQWRREDLAWWHISDPAR